jgi:hypothetical protein
VQEAPTCTLVHPAYQLIITLPSVSLVQLLLLILHSTLYTQLCLRQTKTYPTAPGCRPKRDHLVLLHMLLCHSISISISSTYAATPKQGPLHLHQTGYSSLAHQPSLSPARAPALLHVLLRSCTCSCAISLLHVLIRHLSPARATTPSLSCTCYCALAAAAAGAFEPAIDGETAIDGDPLRGPAAAAAERKSTTSRVSLFNSTCERAQALEGTHFKKQQQINRKSTNLRVSPFNSACE